MPTYHAYGVEFTSELALPLFPPGGNKAPDVSVTLGTIDREPGGDDFHFRNWFATPDSLVFDAPGIGRMLVSGGNSIRVHRAPGATDRELASIILASGLAALLMQRRILPLHASAIATSRGAVLTVGRSGAGKSTLLGAFVDAGYAMLADDVTGLVFDSDDQPVALPCGPAIRLWQSSLELLNHASDGLEPVRENLEKYYLPVERFRASPMPIAAIVYLSERGSESLSVRPMRHLHRVECLSRFIFRKTFLRGMDLQKFAFDRMVTLASGPEMIAVRRPSNEMDPAVIAQTVLQALRTEPVAVAV